MSINETLKERGKKYGEFAEHARITQELKNVMTKDLQKWHSLKNEQKEALEMIAHKIGRILNGDPNYQDSWHDISGYATLITNQLEQLGSNGTKHKKY